MNTKTLFLVAVIAALLGVGGWLLGNRSDAATGDVQEGGLLLPGLAERLNDATRLEVRTPDDSFAVQLADGGWGLESKGGYPVRMEEVRQTLIALSELKKRERKTSNPEFYAKLQVEDVDSEGAQSKLVTVHGPSDEVLASVLVGKRRTGGGPPEFYARIPEEATSWLVEGAVDLPASGDAWLDKQILPLDRDLVRAIEVQHPDGEVVFAAEEKEEDTNLVVWDVPSDRELKYETVASSMGTALQYLNFTDVVPADEFERPASQPVLTRIWTWDGERVTVEVFTKPAAEGESEESYWAIFHADEDPSGPPRLAQAVPAPPTPSTPPDSVAQDDGGSHEEGGTAAEEEGAEKESAESTEDEAAKAEEKEKAMRERVAEHSRRVEGWVYRIAPYAKGNLAKRMEDLTKPIEPPEAIAAPETEGASEASEQPSTAETAPQSGAPDANESPDANASSEGNESPGAKETPRADGPSEAKSQTDQDSGSPPSSSGGEANDGGESSEGNAGPTPESVPPAGDSGGSPSSSPPPQGAESRNGDGR